MNDEQKTTNYGIDMLIGWLNKRRGSRHKIIEQNKNSLRFIFPKLKNKPEILIIKCPLTNYEMSLWINEGGTQRMMYSGKLNLFTDVTYMIATQLAYYAKK